MTAPSSVDTPSLHPQVSNRFVLGLLAVGHMVNDWMAGSIWILAPAIAAALGLGPKEVGLILAVNGIAAGITYIPAGIVADRARNPAWLMMISFWWVAAGYFSASLAPGFWAITLLLAIGVMGDAFWHPVATGVLVKRMPNQRAQVLGIHAVGGSIGAEMLGPISAGLLLVFMDWRSSLQVLVIPAVVMGLVFIVISRKSMFVASENSSKRDFRALVRDWSTLSGLGMVSMMILYNMALYGMLAMTPLVLQQAHGLSSLQSGIIFAAMLVVGTLFQPYTGKLSDRIGRKVMIVSFLLVASLFAWLASLVSGLTLFISTLVVSASVLTAIRPVILAAAVEFSRKSESTTLGLVFAILDGVGALGALVAGYAGEFSLSYAYVLAGLLAFAAATVAVMMKFGTVDAN